MKKILLLISAAALLVACTDSFDQLDKNRDGVITSDEVPAGQEDNFERADTNENGELSREEFAIFRQIEDSSGYLNFETIRDIPYADTTNANQRLDLYLPRARKGDKLPLIVYIHGGSWQKGKKSMGFFAVRPFLLDGRYIGASVEYRFSQQATWPAQIFDCKAAIRWLRANASKYGIDPDRIAVYGGSAGGHLVSMLGTSIGVKELEGNVGRFTNESSRVSCVVDFCGPSDIYQLSLATNSKLHFGRTNSVESILIGGLAAEKRDVARAASPVTYVTSNAPPFLIAHGDKDDIVPFALAEELRDTLNAAHVKTPPILIKEIGGTHIGIIMRPYKELTHRMQQFFDLHLYGLQSDISSEPVTK